jgi:hypothetical protein
MADGDTTFQVAAAIFTFRLLLDGNELSQPPAMSVRHIPGGNVTYTDFGGLEAPRMKGRVLLTNYPDILALQALQGQSGTLIYTEGILPITLTATLMSLTRTKAVGGSGDRHYCSVEFLIDDALP